VSTFARSLRTALIAGPLIWLLALPVVDLVRAGFEAPLLLIEGLGMGLGLIALWQASGISDALDRPEQVAAEVHAQPAAIGLPGR
jgi:hypothetical protein